MTTLTKCSTALLFATEFDERTNEGKGEKLRILVIVLRCRVQLGAPVLLFFFLRWKEKCGARIVWRSVLNRVVYFDR